MREGHYKGKSNSRQSRQSHLICDVVVPLSHSFIDFHAARILQTRAESVFCFRRQKIKCSSNIVSLPDKTEGNVGCPVRTMITTNISIRTILTQITGVQEEKCTGEALEAAVVVDTTEEEDMLLSILASGEEEEVTTTLGEEEGVEVEVEGITTGMEREEGNTTTMRTRGDNFHLEQVPFLSLKMITLNCNILQEEEEEEDTQVHHPASSQDLPRLTAILRTVTTGDITRASGASEITGRTTATARTLTTTGAATTRRGKSPGRETNLPKIV